MQKDETEEEIKEDHPTLDEAEKAEGTKMGTTLTKLLQQLSKTTNNILQWTHLKKLDSLQTQQNQGGKMCNIYYNKCQQNNTSTAQAT